MTRPQLPRGRRFSRLGKGNVPCESRTSLRSCLPASPATRELADRYGLKFTLTENDMFMHAAVAHILDFEGKIRARFHGLKWDQINMVVYVNALTNDRH